MQQTKQARSARQTMYQKILASHTVFQIDQQHVALYADLHIMNEYTSPQAFTEPPRISWRLFGLS